MLVLIINTNKTKGTFANKHLIDQYKNSGKLFTISSLCQIITGDEQILDKGGTQISGLTWWSIFCH